MNKKLIYILNHYSQKSEQHFFHVINLLETIAKSGIQIALIIEKSDDIVQLQSENIKVYAQKKKSKIGRIVELFIILFKLQKEGYQKVFVRISWVAACISILVGFFSKLKTYYWLSGQGSIENYQSLKWGIQKIKLLITSRFPFWFIKSFVYRFVTGPESMGEYMSKVMKVPPQKILILYNDIDISRFSRATDTERINYKTQFGLPIVKKLILFVHRLSPVRKTLFYMPFIISEFFRTKSRNDYHFAFAGSGPEENELKIAIDEAKVNDCITLLGAIPNNKIDKLYKSADIFINPTYAEGFPRVLIEAMACGLPVVTTNAGGILDILDNRQKKYMVDKDDRENFAKKLVALSNDMEEQDRLSLENLSQVLKFSTENVSEMYTRSIFNT